ncbi:hypothetical protein V7794_22980 [Rhizobium laguerreae]
MPDFSDAVWEQARQAAQECSGSHISRQMIEAAYDVLKTSTHMDRLTAFKQAFYNNTGDETDDPFMKAFEAIGWSIPSAEPSTRQHSELLQAARSLVRALAQTQEHAEAMRRLRAAVESLS